MPKKSRAEPRGAPPERAGAMVPGSSASPMVPHVPGTLPPGFSPALLAAASASSDYEVIHQNQLRADEAHLQGVQGIVVQHQGAPQVESGHNKYRPADPVRKGDRLGWAAQEGNLTEVKRLLKKLTNQEPFVVSFGGHSSAAAHGNYYNQVGGATRHKFVHGNDASLF